MLSKPHVSESLVSLMSQSLVHLEINPGVALRIYPGWGGGAVIECKTLALTRGPPKVSPAGGVAGQSRVLRESGQPRSRCLVSNNNNRRLVTLAEHTSDHGRQTNSSTEEKGEQV